MTSYTETRDLISYTQTASSTFRMRDIAEIEKQRCGELHRPASFHLQNQRYHSRDQKSEGWRASSSIFQIRDIAEIKNQRGGELHLPTSDATNLSGTIETRCREAYKLQLTCRYVYTRTSFTVFVSQVVNGPSLAPCRKNDTFPK